MDEITGERQPDPEKRLYLQPAASLLLSSADGYPTLRLHSAVHTRCPVSPAEGVSSVLVHRGGAFTGAAPLLFSRQQVVLLLTRRT